MRYDYYDVQDFAADARFVQWVKEPDEELQAFWRQWLEQHPDKQPLVEEARQLVLFLHFNPAQPTPDEEEAVKRAILNRIRDDRQESDEPLMPPVAAPFFRKYLPVAAAVAAILLLTVLFFRIDPFSKTLVYQTRQGEMKHLTLADGTEVTLNAHTTLRVPAAWPASGPREVWMNGEAFFHVRRQPAPDASAARPFIVHTDALDVRVLGTEFNVHDRPGRVQVVLTSGKVNLTVADEERAPITMQPGELVELEKPTRRWQQRVVDTNRYTAWLSHKLIFDETPLREVMKTIEENYNVKVECRDPNLIRQRFTGSVPNNQLNVLLKVLSESFQIQITQRENRIIMSRKP